jgi:hypothetical protein
MKHNTLQSFSLSPERHLKFFSHLPAFLTISSESSIFTLLHPGLRISISQNKIQGMHIQDTSCRSGQRRYGLLKGRSVFDMQYCNVAVNSLDQSRQDRPGTDLYKSINAIVNHNCNRVFP